MMTSPQADGTDNQLNQRGFRMRSTHVYAFRSTNAKGLQTKLDEKL